MILQCFFFVLAFSGTTKEGCLEIHHAPSRKVSDKESKYAHAHAHACLT
jgi:hypothetical protein